MCDIIVTYSDSPIGEDFSYMIRTCYLLHLSFGSERILMDQENIICVMYTVLSVMIPRDGWCWRWPWYSWNLMLLIDVEVVDYVQYWYFYGSRWVMNLWSKPLIRFLVQSSKRELARQWVFLKSQLGHLTLEWMILTLNVSSIYPYVIKLLRHLSLGSTMK